MLVVNRILQGWFCRVLYRCIVDLKMLALLMIIADSGLKRQEKRGYFARQIVCFNTCEMVSLAMMNWLPWIGKTVCVFGNRM